MRAPIFTNLLTQFGTREQALYALEADQTSDLARYKSALRFMELSLLVAAIAAAFGYGWIPLVIGIWAGFDAVCRWVELSNRNFAMHTITLLETASRQDE